MTEPLSLMEDLRNAVLYDCNNWESGLPLEAASLIERLTAENMRLREALTQWDAWEGRMILDASSWSVDGGFAVTGRLCDEYVELQMQRSKALAENR